MNFLDTVAEWLFDRPITNRRRARILQEPFPSHWQEYLVGNVAIYSLLSPSRQEQLRQVLRILVAERRWEGCGGLSITDEIKVTIAAQASLMLLGIDHDYFNQVPSVLVYPTMFDVAEAQPVHPGVIQEEQVAAIGQAWQRGPVILAWKNVLAQGRDLEAGRNVVIHEFAHQLDFQGEWPHRASGAEMTKLGRRWNRVITTEYDRLVRAFKEGRATLLDQYGASNPMEFFAVASECFFVQPSRLKPRHPRLYELLADFYGLDPEGLYGASASG